MRRAAAPAGASLPGNPSAPQNFDDGSVPMLYEILAEVENRGRRNPRGIRFEADTGNINPQLAARLRRLRGDEKEAERSLPTGEALRRRGW